jgi:hypothetical protein
MHHKTAFAHLLWLLASALATGAQAQALPEPMEACRSDALQHCAGVRPGGGRVLACLELKQTQLSPGCKSALPQAKQCLPEVQRLCDAQGSQEASALTQCAKARQAHLSAACRPTAAKS